MSDGQPQSTVELITSRARGIMLDHSSSQIQVRELPPVIADEKSSAGGQDRGPSPLEYILIGLCA